MTDDNNDDYVYCLAVNHSYEKREFYLGMFKRKQDSDEMECVEMSTLTDERFQNMSYSDFMLEFEQFKSQSMTKH